MFRDRRRGDVEVGSIDRRSIQHEAGWKSVSVQKRTQKRASKTRNKLGDE